MFEGVGHGHEERLFQGGIKLSVMLFEAVIAFGDQSEGTNNLIFNDERHAHC